MTSQNALLERNLKLLIWLKVLYSCLFMNGIFLLYFMDNGLTDVEFFQAFGFMSLAIVISEIPVNYLSDRWQHKWGHFMGACILVLAHVWLFLTEGFWFAAVFYAMLGVGFSFIRGSYGALLYDSLAALDRIDQHEFYQSRIGAYSRSIMGITGVLSGFVFVYAPQGIVLIQMIPQVMLAVLTLMLVEPPRVKIEGSGLQLNLLGQAFKQAFSHKDLKWLVLIISIFVAAQSKAFYVIQPVMLEMKFTLNVIESADVTRIILIGIVSAFAQFSIAAAMYNTKSLKNILSDKGVVVLCCVLASMGYLLCGFFHGMWQGLFFIMAVFLASGFAQVVTNVMIHERISSEIRATVTAMRSMVVGLVFFVVNAVFAWSIDIWSFAAALFVTGSIVLMVSFGCMRFIRFQQANVSKVTVLS
ncbi:MAG: MFS transporter [Pseudomonadota bacterium]|nr:MFS transporter [Pseudomonadota bacterium]